MMYKAVLNFANKTYGKKSEKSEPVCVPEEIKMEEKPVEEVLQSRTLDWAFRSYIQQKIDDGSLSQSTLNGYDIIRRLHFQDIMQMPIDTITVGDLQVSFDEERRKGASRKTLLNYRGVMKKIMEQYNSREFDFNVTIDK